MIRLRKNKFIVPQGCTITDRDRRIFELQQRGIEVPTYQLIKTPEQIEGIRKSGVINTGALDLVAENIRPGMSTLELDKMVAEFLDKHGAKAAPPEVGFPGHICTSLNEVVCHGIPSADEIIEEGDIVNVDISSSLNGYYSDAARMFIIGETTEEKRRLVEVTEECLRIGAEACKAWGFVGDIGKAIEPYAKKHGFSVVRDLCGHGVGCGLHEEPQISHHDTRSKGMLLVPGMVLTIEPMINAGTWRVFVDQEDGWTIVTDDERPSAQVEHTFLITEEGLEILTY